MALASIVHPQSSIGVLIFLAATTDGGWPFDTANVDEEALMSPGVDGMRYRVTSKQQRQFEMTTWMDATSYQLAIALAQLHLAAKTGDPVTLTITLDGNDYTYQNVHIDEVTPQAQPGGMYGLNAQDGSAAKVVTRWKLTLMDPTKSGTTT